jgi:hypothetical protein
MRTVNVIQPLASYGSLENSIEIARFHNEAVVDALKSIQTICLYNDVVMTKDVLAFVRRALSHLSVSDVREEDDFGGFDRSG